MREGHHVFRKTVEGRVGIFLFSTPSIFLFGVSIVFIAVVQNLHHAGDGSERPSEVKQLVLFQVGILHTDTEDALSYIIEILQGEVFHFLHQSSELTHLHEPLIHLFCVAAESHLVHLFLAEWR